MERASAVKNCARQLLDPAFIMNDFVKNIDRPANYASRIQGYQVTLALSRLGLAS
jgi:hypothetical protein